ncbi:hypothetical protein QFC19_000431 [Naganishia cerealis]|uniref:Uncharacterized protein n=1 Tax=Naganishia cerealis TaxID=610337 RepID=A0ACC2WP52_9TREE|nr:hypothetical protein QFC19_000431 [Naganishia cerealis]
MAWRDIDTYPVATYQGQGGGQWWDPPEEEEDGYAAATGGIGRGMFVPPAQQQQPLPPTENEDSAAASVVPYQSILNCFTLSHLNSTNRPLLIRHLPSLPVTLGAHSRDPTTLSPSAGSAFAPPLRSRSRDRAHTFRSVSEAEQWRAQQLERRRGVDPRFDWNAWPRTVGWRLRGEAEESTLAMGRGRDVFDPLAHPPFIPTASSSPSTTRRDSFEDDDPVVRPRSGRRRRMSAEEVQRIRERSEGTSKGDGGVVVGSAQPLEMTLDGRQAPTRPRRHRTPRKRVKFAKDLENPSTAPTILSRYFPYVVWAEGYEAEEAKRVREKEEQERQQQQQQGAGVGSGTGRQRSKYNPRVEGNPRRYTRQQQQGTSVVPEIPYISEYATSTTMFSLPGLSGLGFGSSSSAVAVANNNSNKLLPDGGTTNAGDGTSIITRAPSIPAHRAKTPTKPALLRPAVRMGMMARMGRAVGGVARNAWDALRGATVGAVVAGGGEAAEKEKEKEEEKGTLIATATASAGEKSDVAAEIGQFGSSYLCTAPYVRIERC